MLDELREVAPSPPAMRRRPSVQLDSAAVRRDDSGGMRSDELEYCENCGSHSRFVPIFAAACSTRRCSRCGGWSYVGEVASDARQLYDREYFFGGEYRDYA